MNGRGKSDGPIVPRKPANNGVAARLDPVTRAIRPRSGWRKGGRPRAICFEAPGTGHSADCPCMRHWSGCGRGVCACALRPKVGARCGSSARRDLSGGHPARGVPTGILIGRKGDVHEQVGVKGVADGFRGLFPTSIPRCPEGAGGEKRQNVERPTSNA